MLQAHFTHVKLNETERKEYSKDITITPLAIPMLCGPGAIPVNSIDGRCFGIYFQNSISSVIALWSAFFLLYSVRVPQLFKILGGGKQCDDQRD